MDLKKLQHKITENKGKVRCSTQYEGMEEVCHCQLDTEDNNSIWTISSWYTKKGYGNHGIGRASMKELLDYMFQTYGSPKKIQYIWNGANAYVMDFLEENFDAVCNCPIAVQKTQAEDDWDSHMYTLNKDKVLSYFHVLKA